MADAWAWDVERDDDGLAVLRCTRVKAKEVDGRPQGAFTDQLSDIKSRGEDYGIDVSGLEWEDESFFVFFRDLKNTNPLRLRCGHSWLSPASGKELTKWIKFNKPKLRSLNLEVNGFGDDVAEEMCQALADIARRRQQTIDVDFSLNGIRHPDKLLEKFDETSGLRLTIVSPWACPRLAEHERLWKAFLTAPLVRLHKTLDDLGWRAPDRWMCAICNKRSDVIAGRKHCPDITMGGLSTGHLFGKEHQKKCKWITPEQEVVVFPIWPRDSYFFHVITGEQGWYREDALQPLLSPQPSWERCSLWLQKLASSDKEVEACRVERDYDDTRNTGDNELGSHRAAKVKRIEFYSRCYYGDASDLELDPDEETEFSLPDEDWVANDLRGGTFKFRFRDFWSNCPLRDISEFEKVVVMQHATAKSFHGDQSTYFGVTIKDWKVESWNGWKPDWRVLLCHYSDAMIEDSQGLLVARLTNDDRPNLQERLEELVWHCQREDSLPPIRPNSNREIRDAFRATRDKRQARLSRMRMNRGQHNGMSDDIDKFLREKMGYTWKFDDDRSNDTIIEAYNTETGLQLRDRIYMDPETHVWELDTDLEIEWRNFLVESHTIQKNDLDRTMEVGQEMARLSQKVRNQAEQAAPEAQLEIYTFPDLRKELQHVPAADYRSLINARKEYLFVADLCPCQDSVSWKFSGGWHRDRPILWTLQELENLQGNYVHQFTLEGCIWNDRVYVINTRRLICLFAALGPRAAEVKVEVNLLPLVLGPAGRTREGVNIIRKLKECLEERWESYIQDPQAIGVRSCPADLQQALSKRGWYNGRCFFPSLGRKACGARALGLTSDSSQELQLQRLGA